MAQIVFHVPMDVVIANLKNVWCVKWISIPLKDTVKVNVPKDMLEYKSNVLHAYHLVKLVPTQFNIVQVVWMILIYKMENALLNVQ